MNANHFRSMSGMTGVYGAAVSLGILALVIAAALFVPPGSALDLYMHRHHAVRVWLASAVFFGSMVTLVSALFGFGRARGFGIALSFVDLVASVLILGGGQ